MSHWSERTIEEQRLLNPSFCSMLLWFSSFGHAAASAAGLGLTFEECFLVLPMVLHRDVRESLPGSVATSLAVWVGNNPLAPATVADRARALIPFTREAIRFGGCYGVLQFQGTTARANPDWRKRMAASRDYSSDEVRICANRAEFIGRWFSRTGDAVTIMSIIGVQP